MKVGGSYCYYCSRFKHNFDGINFPLLICYTTNAKTFQQLLPTTIITKITLKITTGKCNQNHCLESSPNGEYVCSLIIHLSSLRFMWSLEPLACSKTEISKS